jgi:hypothetical protein
MTKAIAKVSGLHPFFYRTINAAKTDSYINSPLSEKQENFPLLLFSHALGQYLEQSITQMQELASHGFIVCSIAHTYYCAAVARQDGTITTWIRSPTTPGQEEKAWERSIAYNKRLRAAPEDEVEMQWEEVKAEGLYDEVTRVWCEDHRFILDKIAELNQGLHSPVFTRKIDTEKIGAFGCSFGGGIAILTALYDDRVKAGANIDGTFWRHPDGVPKINKPLMTVLNMNMNDQKIIRNGYEFIPEERNIALFEKSTSDAYYLTVHNAAHANATDLAFLSPILKIVKMTGTIDAEQYHHILNEYLIAFFRKYLYAAPSSLLDGQENKHKDVELRTRNVELL